MAFLGIYVIGYLKKAITTSDEDKLGKYFHKYPERINKVLILFIGALGLLF